MRSSWSVLHAEVQVEPVGQLDLEANSDSIVPFLTGNVQDEPAVETQTETIGLGPVNVCGNSPFMGLLSL